MKFTYEITREDYYEFNKFDFFDKRFRKTLALGILICDALYVFLKNDEQSVWLNSIPVLVAGAVFTTSVFVRLRQTKNIPDEKGSILGEKEIEFGEEHISCSSRHTNATYTWSSIKELKENGNAFYLYMDQYVAILLPKRLFSGEADLQSFRNLVNSKIVSA